MCTNDYHDATVNTVHYFMVCSDISTPIYHRYHRTISVSELYRMRDTVEIEELGSTGRTVSLLPGASSSPLKDSLDDREVCKSSFYK